MVVETRWNGRCDQIGRTGRNADADRNPRPSSAGIIGGFLIDRWIGAGVKTRQAVNPPPRQPAPPLATFLGSPWMRAAA